MEKRHYKNNNRRAQSEQTELNILSSAKQLFRQHGYDKVTIDAIAKEAGVAKPTVYAKFKSKRGLLAQIIDNALPPEQHADIVANIYAAPTAKQQLQYIAKLSRELYQAEFEKMEWVRTASIIDPVFKQLEQEREQRRLDRQTKGFELISQKGMLAKHLPKEKLRDLLWTYTGRDFYRMLVIERKWSNDDYEAWLEHTLITTLLSN